MSEFRISPLEANRWWEKNSVVGVLLNRLMILFILGPIALVFRQLYVASVVVFAFMIPYGFLVRYLAVRAVRQYVSEHPEAVEEFTRKA
jgi:hypothetical protein